MGLEKHEPLNGRAREIRSEIGDIAREGREMPKREAEILTGIAYQNTIGSLKNVLDRMPADARNKFFTALKNAQDETAGSAVRQ